MKLFFGCELESSLTIDNVRLSVPVCLSVTLGFRALTRERGMMEHLYFTGVWI